MIDDKRFGKAFHKTALKRVEVEIPYRSKDESIEREFKLRIKRLGDGPVALLFLDLTRQKNLETVRRDFVANVSHELRSPLTSLAGFIETMLGGEVPDEAMRRRFLTIMDEEAQRMSRLIDDLLSLSRVEVDEHIVPDNQVKLIDVISMVRNSLVGRASQRGMSIAVSDQRVDQKRVPLMLGSFDEPHLKTGSASYSPLWLMLHTSCNLKPISRIIVSVNKCNFIFFCKIHIFFFS